MSSKRGAAKRTGRSRKPEEASGESSTRVRIALEALGLAIVGASLLALLAVATFQPADPIFALAPVENAAGAVGATLAAILFGGVGWGSFVLLAASLVLGVRLLAGLAPPGFASRFWFSTVLLVLSLTTLPPLLHGLAPARFAAESGGALGSLLARFEQAWISTPGALLMNGLLLGVGALGILGVAPGTALRVVLGALAWSGRQLARVGRGLLVATGLARIRAVAIVRGSLARVTVWRERRARRVRVVAQQQDDPSNPGREDILAALASVKKGGRGNDPDIVDHRHSGRPEPEQGSFSFSEHAPSGPYELPDVGLFQLPPPAGRTYDRDSTDGWSRCIPVP
jgi:hypothetical protein